MSTVKGNGWMNHGVAGVDGKEWRRGHSQCHLESLKELGGLAEGTNRWHLWCIWGEKKETEES